MTKVILTLDDQGLRSGFMPVTKINSDGHRTGKMPIIEVVRLFRRVCRMQEESMQVHLFTRFGLGDYVAIGSAGPKWVAVKELPPAEYFLTTVTGKAFKVQLPRLIARVSNMESSYLFWTEDEVLKPTSLVYPLIIGNISSSGWVCIGSTRLKCSTPEEINAFIRKVIEAPSTGTYLPEGTKVEEFYQSLTERWDKSVGAKFGRPLERLLASSYS